MRFAIALAGLALTLAGPLEVARSQDEEPSSTKTSSLIKQLSARTFRERETAMLALIEIGAPAIGPMISKLDGTNRERDQRIVKIFVTMLRSEKTTAAAAEAALEKLLESPNDAVTRKVAGAVGDLKKLAQQRFERLGATVSNQYGRLSITIPDGWKHGEKPLSSLRWLTNVQQLNISGVELTDKSLEYLKPLNQVQYLQIKCGDVTAKGLANLERKWNLRSLNLTFREGVPLSLPDLSKVPQLYYLYVTGGTLSEKNVKDLAGHGRLSNLTLRQVMLPNNTLSNLQQIPNLRYLYMYGCDIGNGAALGKFTNLQSLILAGTPVGDSSLQHLTNSKNLSSLDLSGTMVTGKGISQLASLTRLRSLNLRYSEVRDEFVPEILKLTKLTTVYLDGTNVTGKAFKGLKPAPHVRTLDLAFRPITDEAIPDLVKAFPGLQSLNLTHSLITNKSLKELEKLSNLRELFIKDSRVTTTAYREFMKKRGRSVTVTTGRVYPPPSRVGAPATGIELLKGWPAVKRLRLYGVPVNEAGINQIARRFPDLEDIRLYGTSLDDKAIGQLSKLKKLRKLGLVRCPNVTAKGLELAGKLDLTRLELTQITLESKHIAALPLTKLQELYLLTTAGDDDVAKLIERNPDLRRADFRKTNIGDTTCLSLKKCAKLEYLDVSTTKVTDAGLQHLATLKTLKTLKIGRTHSKEAVAKLQEALPDCKISK